MDWRLFPENPAALRRLFMVLFLDNAIKYSHAGSEVIVGILTGDGTVAVTVEDFGIGVSSADLPHIFKRFYQADKARTDGGFGLGLSLADSIAKAHGAAIDVTSEEGRGAQFQVVFQARFFSSSLGANPAEAVESELKILRLNAPRSRKAAGAPSQWGPPERGSVTKIPTLWRSRPAMRAAVVSSCRITGMIAVSECPVL